jgi:dCTP deaminase
MSKKIIAMYLSKNDLEAGLENKSIVVEPLFPDSVNGATIDLHLGKHFMVYKKGNRPMLDLMADPEEHMDRTEITVDKPFILHPKQFALGVLIERTGVDGSHVGVLDGISSLARMGLAVHITASTLNPGNSLCMTLELYNFHDQAVNLFYGMPVAQIKFGKLTSPVPDEFLYKGYYEGEVPQPSKFFKNFTEEKNSWLHFVKKIEAEKVI